jgi:hypothetical protein
MSDTHGCADSLDRHWAERPDARNVWPFLNFNRSPVTGEHMQHSAFVAGVKHKKARPGEQSGFSLSARTG